MSELWVKWKYRLVLAACVWMLLAAIFVIQRYGNSIFLQETHVALWNKFGDFILLRWLNSTIITGFLAIIAALIGTYALWTVTIYTRQNSHRDALLVTSATAHSIAEDICKNNLPLNYTQLKSLEDQCAFLLSINSSCGLDVYQTALQITRWSKLGPTNSLLNEAGSRAKAISVLCSIWADNPQLSNGVVELIDPLKLRIFVNRKAVFDGYTNYIDKYFDWSINFPSTPPTA